MSGGKTYTAVTDMLFRLSGGHQVCTNIRLNCRSVTSFLGTSCINWKKNYFYLTEDKEELKQFHALSLSDYKNYPLGSPRGSLTYDRDMVYIYLDEVSSVFDSITHSSQSEIKEVATWARHTLKRGQMVILIMQFSSELHKRLRNHITEYWSCVNTSTLRVPVFNIRLPFFLRGYIVITKYLGDEETRVSASKWHPIDSRVFTCYNTAQIVYGGQIGTFYERGIIDTSFTKPKREKELIWLLFLIELALIIISFCILSFIRF